MSKWSGERVLVTGGAGFIGSHLTRELVGLGARVRVVDNLVRGRKENLDGLEIEFIKGDLTDPETCARVCRDMGVVFHLASKVGGIGYYMNKPAEVYEHNVLIDTLTVRAARAAGVGRFIFASSAHVYPRRLQAAYEAPALREEDAYPADPAISYGWAKLFTERLLQYFESEDSEMSRRGPKKVRRTLSASLRICGAYGENQDIGLETGSVIPVFCRRAIEFPGRSPFTMLGLGKETRSYCYVGDVVAGLIECAARLEASGTLAPLNLGTEGRISILEIARMVIETSGKKIHIEHLPAQESGIRGQAVDMGKTKGQLGGWMPKVQLHHGILKTYRNIEERLRNGAG